MSLWSRSMHLRMDRSRSIRRGLPTSHQSYRLVSSGIAPDEQVPDDHPSGSTSYSEETCSHSKGQSQRVRILHSTRRSERVTLKFIKKLASSPGLETPDTPKYLDTIIGPASGLDELPAPDDSGGHELTEPGVARGNVEDSSSALSAQPRITELCSGSCCRCAILLRLLH